MKKSIFKKLGGLFLGLAMGLGVVTGVTAGNKVSEVNAGSKELIIDGEKLTSTATTEATDYDYGGFTITMSDGAKQQSSSGSNKFTAKAILIGKSGKYIYNKDPIGNKITKFEIYANKGASAKVSVGVCFSTTKINAYSAGTNTYTATLATLDNVYDCSSKIPDGAKYFWFQVTNANNSQVEFRITYEEAVTKYDVSFNMQGHGTAPTTQSIEAGGKVIEPTEPSVSGYIFDGWYEEAACTNKWNFSTGTISGTKVLYAKWTAKTALQLAADGVNLKLGDSDEEVEVTAGGNKTSGYTLSSGNTNAVTIVNNKLHVVGLGDATITITKAEDANNTYTSGTFNVHVDYADITSFELDYTEGTLGKGGEATLPGVTILPANANQGYSWGNAVATEGIVYSYDPSTHELAIGANNAVEGTIQFTATATGDSSKKATVVYTVQAAQIANITGVTASATGAIVAKQYVGDAFNAQGFSFAPTWSEGEHDDVEITANDISWNELVAGSNPTGTYSCADGNFTVTITGVTVVNDTIVSIAFAEGCDMTKKSYNVGDSWDFSGLSIVGTMDSGKTAPAIASSNVTFSSNDAVATDTTSITVTASYQGLTTAIAKTISGIEVKEVTMTSLSVNYTGGQPVLGTDFTFAGSITANMSNGTHPTVNLSDVTIGSVDKFTLNQQTVTVTHKTTGATGTFNVTYKTKSITYTDSFKSSSIKQGRLMIATKDDSNNWYYLPTDASGGADNPPVKATLQMSNNLPVAPTNNSKDYMWNFTGSGDTYTITNDDGKYLYTTAANNGVRVNTTSTVTWTYNSTNKTLVSSGGRYLGVYTTGNDWRSYTSNHANYSGTGGNIVFYEIISTPSGTADIIKFNAALKSGKTFNEGATISASDFDCSTLDNLNQTKTVTATNVSPTNLVAGENTITVYYNTWSTTVTVNAAEVAHLDHIEVVEGTGTRSFTRGTSFNYTGLKIKAYYSNTDKTKFPDRELTSGFTVTPLTSAQMNVADTYDVSVSYTENGVNKSTTYSVTVTPKVSTSVTIAGDGIEGSNGAYTLASGVTNEVALTLGCNGDETVEFVQGEQSVVTFVNGSLIINSSTTTSEQITVSFKAGSATATLTVNISAAEGIQLLSDKEIVGYVGSSFSYDINIQLNNVESATWTLPQGDFVIESETEDNTGFVGTIYFTDEVSDTLTFSALTGKGKTLSVDIEVLAVNDDIKSISASLKSGVTYSAGKGQTFSNDDLTVKFERDSGAKGTLASNEFTVSGLPEGSFNRVTSYDLTITSVENTNAKTSLTINVGMPSDLDLNFVTSTTVTEDGETYWKKVTDLSTISTSKQYVFILENGANSKIFNGVDDSTADDAETPVGYINTSVSNGEATYTEGSPYLTINYNSSSGEASIKCVGGSNTLAGEYIYGKSGSNGISHGATETFMSFVMEGDDNHIVATSNSTSFRFNATANNNRFRFFKTTTTGNAYSYPCLYELATKPGDSHLEYSNVNETTDTANKYDFAKLYNFIALANETYADICGSEGNNQKPDLDTWRSVLESAEYNALVADTDSYNLLKSAICGEGAYGSNGRYVPDGEKQSSAMVIEFLQKYDRVVSNYSSENYNYLGRDVTSPSPRINPILALNEVDSSVWVISAVALVGLTAIGGYFFYRKRKEI